MSQEKPPTFVLEKVRKVYGAQVALEATDLSIPPRETTVLIGPSGCGKSTMVRLMIGLLRPDQGQIRFEGQPLGQSDILELRHKMGYVIQDGGLFPHLTAEGNIKLMARYLGRSRDQVDARIDELCSLVNFPADGLARYPAQLSGGQRQRVSLMRALMLDPDVLLLDEPLGALDPLIRADLQQDLREIFRQLGKTVVMVTHDMGEAAFFADRIVLMREGRIVQVGTLEDLLERPADEFVTDFINAQRSVLDTAGSGQPT
jgi:osmoprotectant transport system ATP-binding protein